MFHISDVEQLIRPIIHAFTGRSTSMLPRVKTVALLCGCCLSLTGCGEKGSAGAITKGVASTDPAVVFTLPVYKEVADFEEFPGRTEAVFSVEVRARVTGYLAKVDFKDGDEVAEGSLLFEIDDRSYKAEADRAESTLAQSVAHAKRLDADFKRASTLYSRGALSREEYDKIAGDHIEAEASVNIAQAVFELAKLNLSFTKVTAPIAGRLSRRLVDPGNLVKADETSLVSLVSLDPIHVSFDIDERTLLRLRRLVREGKIKSREETELQIMIGLADEGLEFPYQATINFSDNKIDPGTGTLRVRGVLPNPKPRVFSPGLFARIKLPVGSPRQALMVPELAVGTSQDKKFVYVINDQNVIVEKKVTVGLKKDQLISIEDEPPTVTPKDRIIVSGLQRIRSGMVVSEKNGVLRATTPPKGSKSKDEKTKSLPGTKLAEAGPSR